MADTHRSRVPGGRRGWGSVAITWVAVLLLSAAFAAGCGDPPNGSLPDEKPVDFGDLPRGRPVDFGFVLGYGVGGSDEIDTFAYTFTRDMGHELPMSTGIAFSPTELDELYQRLVEMGIYEYPREFDPGGASAGTSTPFESYHFRMRADGREYEILWDDTDRSAAPEAEALRGLFRDIKTLVEAQEEYGQMLEFRARMVDTGGGESPGDLKPAREPLVSGQSEDVAPSHEVRVPNGGFEQGSKGWSFVQHFIPMTDYGGAVGEPYTIAGDANSGSKAARLAVDGHQYMGLMTSLWGQTPIERSIEVDQTGAYTLSAFLKIDGKPGFVSYVDMYVTKYVTEPVTGLQGMTEQVVEQQVGRTEIITWEDGYREYRLDGLELARGDHVAITIGLGNDAEAESQLYVDDVRLYVPGEGTP